MYSIIRINKIKSRGHATQALEHNLRLRQQANIDEARSKLNKCLFDGLNVDNSKASSFQEKLSEKYDKLGIKEKKDNVFCLEFELSASPEFWFGHIKGWNVEDWNKLSMDNPADRKVIRGFWNQIDVEKVNKWRSAQVDFAKKEWGESLERIDFHLDEKSPHMHILINTAQKTVKKYRNQKGEFFKENYSLNAKRFNPQYLTGLQDRYSLKNSIFGLTRGEKGSKRKHKKLKDYYEEQAKNTLEIIMKNEKLTKNNKKFNEVIPLIKNEMNENYRKINTLLDVLSDKELTQEESELIEEIKKTMGRKEKPKPE
jgi:hypothetical protein